MSLTFIHDFQNRIYTTLVNDVDLMLLVKKVYIGASTEAKGPFVLINITKAEDLSIHKIAQYEIDFQISVYAQDLNYGTLAIIADYCVKNLSLMNKLFGGYVIDGLKANSIIFDKAKDLVLNRMVIDCKAFIKRKS
jgi:hypothetical protein